MVRDPGNKISAAANLGALAKPKTVRNLIGKDNPFDFYKVVFRSPGFLSASLSGLKNNANLALLNRVGKVIQRSRKPGKREDLIQLELGVGKYYLRVEGKAKSTRYKLQLAKGLLEDGNSSIATAEFIGTLSGTKSIEGTIGGADTEDYYRFNLNVTRDVSFSLTDATGTLALDLLDLNGNLIQTDRPTRTAATRVQPLPTGTHAVRVRTTAPEQGAVPYRLNSVAVQQPVQPQGNLEYQPSISAIATLNGSLSTTDALNPLRLGSYADDYILAGVTAGQQIQLNLNSTAFDPFLQIIDAASGQEVASNDDASGTLNSELVFTVPSAATYRVRVTSYRSAAVGDYVLTTSPPAQSIGVLAEQTGSLETTDPDNPLRPGSRRDDYRLTGVTAGQELRINLDSAGFDPYLQIVNAATGELIDFNDDIGGGNNNSSFVLTAQPGTNYILRVTSFDSGATGGYSLRTGPNVDAIAPSQIIGSTLDWLDQNNSHRSGSFADDYLLTGASVGQTIRVNLSADFDTYLQLVNAQTGDLIDYNDDSNGTLNSELTFTVESGINYLIRASSYAANVEGNYTLETSASAPIVSISGDETINGSLSSTDADNPQRLGSFYDEYQLTGLGVGQTVRANLGAEGFDTYLQLVNGAGELIDANDDANGTLNSELSFTVQAGINYRLRATSFGSGSTGSYVLTTSTAGNWVVNNLTDPGLREVVNNLSTDRELSRVDMMAIFRSVGSDDNRVDTFERADLRTLVENSARFNMRDYVQYLSQQVANSISEELSATSLERIIGRYFLGAETPANRFNDLTFGHINVEGNVFGSASPSVSQIAQGGLGDSSFLAALGSVMESRPADIVGPNGMFIDNGDGTFTVRFYSATHSNGITQPDPRAEYVTVDRRLAAVNGNPIFSGEFSASSQAGNAIAGPEGIWVGLVERAYAGWQQSREGQNGYNLIGNGEVPDRPMAHITGQAVSGSASASVGFGAIQAALAEQRAVTAVSSADSTYTLGGQAYSVMQAYVNSAGQQRLQIRNPLGVDGRVVSGADDGLIDLSFEEYTSALQSTYMEMTQAGNELAWAWN